MLILGLPHLASAAASAYAWVRSDGQQVLDHGQAAPALLPRGSGEVVAVVPHSRLAWLRVTVPPGSHGPRLAAVLHGLLEDRLLQEPHSQHIAVGPDATAVARAGGALWVAVCDKVWLRSALAPAQAAGLTLQRIVPECAPTPTPILHLLDASEGAQAVLCSPDGVQWLPDDPAHWPALPALASDALTVLAEPAHIESFAARLGRAPRLHSASQRWLDACNDGWDLAQGEWAQGPSQRLLRQSQALWQSLSHAPQWRALRRGLLALLLVQVLGLQALAWREERAIAEQQAALRDTLTRTFPHVRLVVDAPVQMQRELQALLQQRGQAGARDLEVQLAALASVLPAGQTPSRLDYSEGRLRVQGLSAWPESATASLRARGLRLQRQGEAWDIDSEARTP